MLTHKEFRLEAYRNSAQITLHTTLTYPVQNLSCIALESIQHPYLYLCITAAQERLQRCLQWLCRVIGFAVKQRHMIDVIMSKLPLTLSFTSLFRSPVT